MATEEEKEERTFEDRRTGPGTGSTLRAPLTYTETLICLELSSTPSEESASLTIVHWCCLLLHLLQNLLLNPLACKVEVLGSFWFSYYEQCLWARRGAESSTYTGVFQMNFFFLSVFDPGLIYSWQMTSQHVAHLAEPSWSNFNPKSLKPFDLPRTFHSQRLSNSSKTYQFNFPSRERKEGRKMTFLGKSRRISQKEVWGRKKITRLQIT